MKKSTTLTKTTEKKVTDIMIKLHALRDHVSETYRELERLTSALADDHPATVSAVQAEVDEVRDAMNLLLQTAVNDLWDLSNSMLPDNVRATPEVLKKNAETIILQRNKFKLLVQDSGVFS